MENKYLDLSFLLPEPSCKPENKGVIQSQGTASQGIEQGREGWRLDMKGQVENNQHSFQGTIKF